ncbi:alkaline phosphatase family protein [Paucisalibacillus sp. EB02]|uniref:alkaline phosphatase family protein n=1 Tax=Paucisalibacillus sp. EB02 TaxID=1347087 RepID=UPI0004ADACA9|nr:alkaline phosphatase family protein [Paucisalibacillus sp. EB02]
MAEQKVVLFGVDGLIPELVYKFAREGYLPNISDMMEKGATTELLPYISTWGDVNWVSFLTGQAPGNSWKGQSLPQQNNDHLIGLTQAEGKKCALVHFPNSISVDETNHFSFAPFYGGKEKAPFELASPRVFSTNLDKWPLKEVKESLGWPPIATVAHHEKNNRSSITKVNDEFTFTIQLTNGKDKEVSINLVNDEEIKLILDKDTVIPVQVNSWSDWVTIDVDDAVEGTVRFKLVHYNREQEELDIIQTQILDLAKISSDNTLAMELVDRNGPFIQSWTVKASPTEMYHETSFEEANYQATWLANAALCLLNEKGFDLFATVFRINDETHHTSLGQYDPASPFYSEKDSILYEENMWKSYILLDKTIGKIMKEKDDDTTLILASDHGDVPNTYFCDVYLRLEECGLCVLDEYGTPVLEKSKAYLKDERGGLEIYVNLQGREPNGIVALEDYEAVQQEVFRAITTWSYEGKQVSALTLKKQDASIIGYWGPLMGDVIFAYSQGFVWGTNKKDVVAKVSSPGANHGPQIPSARTEHSSNWGIFVASGRTSKTGYHRDSQVSGPYFMSDAGRTIGDLLGINDTSTLDGRFMTDLFMNNSGSRG